MVSFGYKMQRWPDFSLINLLVQGWKSGTHKYLRERNFCKFAPKLVVFFWKWKDLQFFWKLLKKKFFFQKTFCSLDSQKFIPRNMPFRFNSWKFLLWNLQFWTLGLWKFLLRKVLRKFLPLRHQLQIYINTTQINFRFYISLPFSTGW